MQTLYIHIPFCKKKCFYCSFAVAIAKENRFDIYLESLEKEASMYSGKKIREIYIGGGTPTILKEGQLEKLVMIINKNFKRTEKGEFTIETNPEEINLAKAKLLKRLGVNRISIGVQSLNDKYLKYLGRCHNKIMAIKSFNAVRKAGFRNINLDLMYSFPDQTNDDIRNDINGLASLGSEHISLYTLGIEKNSRFHVQKIKEQDKYTQRRQYELVVKLIESQGFHQYEVSNFSREGMESKHNINYWNGGDYIGIGVGAHSHIKGYRKWNISRLNEYILKIKKGLEPKEDDETLDSKQRLIETFLIGLRMNGGVELKKIEKKIGCKINKDKKKVINELVEGGLLDCSGSIIRATSKGRLVLDELSARLV